jgi:hypothetical protein
LLSLSLSLSWSQLAATDPVNVMAVVIERLTRMNAELMAENKALMGAAVTSFAV